MTARRTVREIKTQADLMALSLQIAQTDIDPVTLKMRLLAAVIQAESYKRLPQWRQSCLQGFCEGLALGRGITAGLKVETPIPSEAPLTEESLSQIPNSSETRSLRPPAPDIEALQRLHAELTAMLAPGAPPAPPPVSAPPTSTKRASQAPKAKKASARR